MPTSILGLAHYLPPEQRVGSVMRPTVSEPIGPSDLALEPGRQALAQAGLAVSDVDLVAFATMTPDVTFPGAACFFQYKLGAGTTAAIDLRGQCAGFITGLMVVDAYLAAGIYRHVLLAAGEVHSSALDYSPAGIATAELYADGAAVAVLGSGDGAGCESIVCHSDGRQFDRFWIEYPSSRQHPLRVTVADIRAGRHYPRIDRAEVEAFALTQLPAVVREACERAGASLAQVDAFILSHALPGVTERCAATLGLAGDAWIDAGAAHGHLTAATLPVALSESLASGRIGRGARVCLAACGAGANWGAAVLRL
ncbi:MAG TPA: 3-oxoacyl-[acyl-carrier-protein] synthase III C-terminal domain-containing protein [Candidatus Dormibacteraeota bacterium]|nr:3-oxoacyl-[acyl-carrier-protein] synthase III C-terminal domain-containing protein [Candidatus Dormibacteraeota bacterium]